MARTERTATPAGLWRFGVTTCLALALAAGLALRFAKRQLPPSLPEVKMRQLTFNSPENPVSSGAISPDGKYLAYSDNHGMHVMVVDTGESQFIPQPESMKGTNADWQISDWFPDSTRFLAIGMIPEHQRASQKASMWVVSVLGGAPRKIRDDAIPWSVSPDGSWIAFGTHDDGNGLREMWLMKSTGEQPRKLLEEDDGTSVAGANWSADGQHLLYVHVRSPNASGAGEDSLEVRDLEGGPVNTVLRSSRLHDFHWLRDGRLLHVLAEPDNGTTCNYWQMRLDPTGKPVDRLKRLTNWVGFCIDGTTATTDGKRVALKQYAAHGSVYLGTIQNDGARMSAPVRLTLSEGWDAPGAWSPDSKAVYIVSNHGGHFGIFKQALNSDTAEAVVMGPEDVAAPRVTPDGKWLLYDITLAHEPAPDRIMRMPISGGPPEPVLTTQLQDIHCGTSPASLCVISQPLPERKQMIFAALDPLKGRGQDLAQIDFDPNSGYNWDVSPDGTHIAVVQRDSEGLIKILPLIGHAAHEIDVKGWRNLDSVTWAANGKSLFVSARVQQGSVLLNVDLRGNANVLWRNIGGTGIGPVPSPDGHHLAIYGSVVSSNMWMMQNF